MLTKCLTKLKRESANLNKIELLKKQKLSLHFVKLITKDYLIEN